jgi:hypothetical protein
VTGPEHYEAAQNILASALEIGADVSREDVRAMVEMAQAHATLALAAATAMASIDRMPDEDYAAWDKVAGVPTRSEDE